MTKPLKISEDAVKKIGKEIPQYGEDSLKKIGKIFEIEANLALPLIGLKKRVDSKKKKILICHSSEDKDLADIIYKLLLFNGAPSEDILYTSCDDQICRIPDGEEVYDYLREFFVESSSNEKIYVIYVTSKNMVETWGAVVEVGAGWITRKDHRIFNIEGNMPLKPLNTDIEWHNSIKNEDGSFSMRDIDCDRFAEKIENICEIFDYRIKNRKENIRRLKTFVNIIEQLPLLNSL